ncbi:ABC transporter permease [Diplocloster agilis]|uniref:Iron ABC transporter permease n=1 Tax=Diplocloster agilis TaxID=2850323 RepID=A0A949JY18_9FIRM|nr:MULTISPECIES: iron ABC transporter permease [Lachnospiraceae]MBU9737303.1 iron ABC transporter permease [Diplocloster agilis]MBU9746901.1 iron ABC transporter permease [Diplocloster agilis]MCU6732604.1 iron ABC transporter permease [Suonthocola fibrivorans]SCI54484.1 Spermidine/putrescine transport system permease protein PotB [uncultured Clostridium sp.]
MKENTKPKKKIYEKLHMDKFNFWTIMSLVILILCLIFIVYPFLKLIVQSFQNPDTNAFTMSNYLKFFQKKYYQEALGHSLLISTVVTILATLLGVPLAYIGSRFNLYWKRLINVMVVLSMLSPPFIGAYAWITLLGRAGFITKLLSMIGIEMGEIYGFKGIVLVFTLKLYPMVYLYVSGALGSIDSSLEEASENLGISGIRRILKITFPVILPTILSSALMVFMTALADFGTPRLIGEGYSTLPVIIYKEFLNEVGTDTGFASALSVIIIIIALVVLFVQKRFVDRKSYNMTSLRPPAVIELTRGKKLLATAVVFFVSFLSVLPQITVTIQSFLKTNGPLFVAGFSLDSYRQVANKLGRSITNTFLYSFIALAIIVLLGLIGSYLIVRRKSFVSNLIDMLLMFPYVIPGAVLGICLTVAFNQGAIVLTGTMWAIIISFVIRKLPYTMRSSVGILYQIDNSVEEASISLGVPAMKTFFKTTVHLMLPGLMSGAVLSLISVMNTLSATLILYTGKTITISVAIFNCVNNDAYGQAAALSTILTLATVVCLLIFNKVSGGKSVV